MAWNEPGNNQDQDNKDKDKNNDPWTGRKKITKPKDLDDALNQLQKKFSSLFTKKSGSNSSSSNKSAFFGVGMIAVALIVVWFVTGFFVVQAAEKSVVLRFGKYETTLGAGLHWIPRFIDSETTVDVQKVHTYTYPNSNDALMLTKDQNIVAVAITVQYKVSNPQDFLYNVVNPINSMQQATASALRQVIGQMNLDEILTTGREQLRQDVKTQLDETLQRYHSGLEITNVLLKSAQAPDEVKAAFDDAIKAQEDEKRYINQAQAYAMKVEPIAEGQAQRILTAAKAYQQSIVLNAKANVAAFLALLPEYKLSPEVTRERMYLDAMQHVFTKSSKIVVDSGNGTNNLLYLPIEKMINAAENSKQNEANQEDAASVTPSNIPDITANQKNNATSSRPTRNQLSDYGNNAGANP